MAPLIPDQVLNLHRRRPLGAAAMSIAAATLGAIGPALLCGLTIIALSAKAPEAR